MNEVRDSIDAAQSFMSQVDFDPWAGICSGVYAAFVERYTDLFNVRVSRKRGGVSQQVSTFDDSSRGVRLDGDAGISAAVLSESAAPAVSAPLVSTSSSSGSFRQSKTPIHSSLASLLGQKKDASKSGGQVKRNTKGNLKDLLPRVEVRAQRKIECHLLNCFQTLL